MTKVERYILPIEYVMVDIRTALGLEDGRPDLTELSNRYAVEGYQPTGLITVKNHPLSIILAQFTHFGLCQEAAELSAGKEIVADGVDDGVDDDDTPPDDLPEPEIEGP